MDSTSSRTIAVLGATGRLGGEVTRHLLRDGWQVRALTRSPDSAKAAAAKPSPPRKKGKKRKRKKKG